MIEEWFWDYIELENSPSFYRIWDEENNTIAHFELSPSPLYGVLIGEMCDKYNALKEEEERQ
jgi:hypothetical protein